MTSEKCNCVRCMCEKAYTDGFNDGIKLYQNADSFYLNRGIIQPIRAIHRQYDTGSYLSDIVEEGINLVDPNFSMDSSNYTEEEKAKYISTFMNKSTVIGYFGASICKNSHDEAVGINIRFSVCRPEDYENYSRARARRNLFSNKSEICFMNHCFESKESAVRNVILMLSFKDKRCIMSEVGSTYYFPITIQKQFEHFLDRCVRYFKIKKKEKVKIVQKKKGNKKK